MELPVALAETTKRILILEELLVNDSDEDMEIHYRELHQLRKSLKQLA